MNESDTFDDLFAPEPAAPEPAEGDGPGSWKVLLVDDEDDIHAVLHLALQDLRVEGRRLQVLDARSAAEARRLLAEHPDISLVLLDVVMETELAGLTLVHHIRREICNRLVQIVLVTGQPGYAPERRIVTEYEIDGYRLKSELTADKIFVSVYVALRTYKALKESDEQRRLVEAMARSLGEKEERLRSVVETAPDAIVQADAEGTIIGWNEGAVRLFGHAPADMLGQPMARLAQPADAAPRGPGNWMQQWTPPLQLGEFVEFEGLRRDGSRLPVEMVVGAWGGDTSRKYSAVIRDVSERKRSESSMRLAASVYAHSYEGIIIANASGDIIDVNPAFTRITGYPKDEVIGRNPKVLASGRHDGAFYRTMWDSLARFDFWQGEITNCRRDGEVYSEMLSLSVVRDSAGAVQHYVGVFSDISQLKAHERELHHIAHFDPLTGVANRRLLSDRLEQSLLRAQHTGRALAVCYLDLDGFKEVNDTFGHAGGDMLLVEVARRMKSVLRADDTLARLGGDEFVLLLTELQQPQDCQRALDRLKQVVQAPLVIGDGVASVSASIGVALYPADDADADTLLRHADQAMYAAKQAGKNGCHFFDALQDRKIQTQRNSLQRLREGLDNGELLLHYQPKANLATGEVIGFEALVRWRHPERGLLYPAEFLGLLDGHDFEATFGEWVIDAVMKQMQAWQAQGLRTCVSANISANHLLRADFAERLGLILARFGDVPPEQLELEILETAALTDLKVAVANIARCRQLGVQFALDDFGTGYSSLTYFLNLPVQVLKIDKSFVMGMLEDPGGLGIVESVVRLASAFNRPVIAEGVESMSHGEMLLQMGCMLAQGYGIARPMPAEQVLPWLQAWRETAPWRAMTARTGADATLEVAERSHRVWVQRIESLVLQPTTDPAAGLDDGSSFARWFSGSGAARYSRHAAFQAMSEPHERALRHARRAIEAARAGRTDEAQSQLQALRRAGTMLLALLERLRREAGA